MTVAPGSTTHEGWEGGPPRWTNMLLVAVTNNTPNPTLASSGSLFSVYETVNGAPRDIFAATGVQIFQIF